MLTGIPALQAVGTTVQTTTRETAGSDGAAAAVSFAEAMGETAARTVGALEKAEALSFDALRGEAQTREVVDAVMSAEQSLQAAIAIRDKIVTAYLEISRMQI